MPPLAPSTLVLGCLLLVILLASIVFYSRWSWWVRATAIAAVAAFCGVAYGSVLEMLGWPTDNALPERFRLLAVHVYEPSKATDSEGRIFLWAADMTGPINAPPRAYEVSYSESLHERVAEAGTKLRKGLPQLGETEITAFRDGKGKATHDASHVGEKSITIRFYDMPDPLFPEK